MFTDGARGGPRRFLASFHNRACNNVGSTFDSTKEVVPMMAITTQSWPEDHHNSNGPFNGLGLGQNTQTERDSVRGPILVTLRTASIVPAVRRGPGLSVGTPDAQPS